MARATDDCRTALRRSQAAVAELQRQLLTDSSPENVFERLDVLTTLMVGNLRQLTQLNELARVESNTVEHSEPSNVALGQIVEQCVGDAKVKCGRLDIEVSTAVDPEAEIVAPESRLNMAFVVLFEHAIRCTPPGGTICLEAETDASGNSLLKIFNPELIGGTVNEAVSILDADADPLRQRGDASNVGLWVAQAILARLSGRISVSGVPGVGTSTEIHFSKEAKVDGPSMPVEHELAEAV